MNLSAKIVLGFQPLTIFTKRSILDVCQGSEYASVSVPKSFTQNIFPGKHAKKRFFHLLQSFITLINLSELYYFDLLIQCYFEIYEFLAFPKYPENCPLEFSRNDS